MRRLLKDRRRAQAGTTLIEVLVSVAIMGLALVLIIGTLSTGLLDASLAKRNTAAQAVMQYEIDQIHSAPFNSSPQSYSECFATESANAPVSAGGYLGPCPAGPFTLRADVTVGSGPTATSQQWTVAVSAWPNLAQAGSPTSVLKANR